VVVLIIATDPEEIAIGGRMSALSRAPLVSPCVSIGIPAGLAIMSVQLVLEEVHLVAGVVVVGARFERTPVVLAR
jgi:hypothetical protein